MWKARNVLGEIMSDMTLDECLKVNEVVAEYKKSARASAAA
jgi:hypothetical protein